MKRRFPLAILLVCIAVSAYAGDAATFVNLGFSEDSGYFMFGEYGIDSSTSTPYAEMYGVDVRANTFVSNGVRKGSFAAMLEAGLDPIGAFFSLLEQNVDLIRLLRVDHLNQGRIIYVHIPGEVVNHELSFRDFKTNTEYLVSLNQSPQNVSGKQSASYFINLKRTFSDGRVQSLVLGNSSIMREGVKSYRVRQIIVSKDERAVVCVVEKEMTVNGSAAVRFMVETALF